MGNRAGNVPQGGKALHVAADGAGRGGVPIPTLFWQSPAAHPPIREQWGAVGTWGPLRLGKLGSAGKNPCGKLLRTDPVLASG